MAYLWGRPRSSSMSSLVWHAFPVVVLLEGVTEKYVNEVFLSYRWGKVLTTSSLCRSLGLSVWTGGGDAGNELSEDWAA